MGFEVLAWLQVLSRDGPRELVEKHARTRQRHTHPLHQTLRPETYSLHSTPYQSYTFHRSPFALDP